VVLPHRASWRIGALRRYIAALALPLLLQTCSAVGVPATDNPYTKLSQADYLWRHAGRVMQARRRVDEAIAIFEERGDQAGLAEAYRQYGFIARVGGANADPVILIKPGSSVGPGGPPPEAFRSTESLDHSDDFFARAVALATEAKRFDMVTNLNFLLGNNQVLRGEKLKACPYYDLSLAASQEVEREKPGIVVDLPPGEHSVADLLARAKQQAGCAPS
jgi:tetratricopeptide (TPR) repeat protein